MDNKLREQLISTFFRLKNIRPIPPRGFDVHMGELAILTGIAENMSDPNSNICMSDIQSGLHITRPAISQILNSLEKKGYIKREIDMKDRRKFVLTITPEGHEIMNGMKEHIGSAVDLIITRFGEEDIKQLMMLVNRLADILDEIKHDTLSAQRKGDEKLD